MTTRRALRLVKILTLTATVSALVLAATSLAACTVPLAGPDVRQVETAVDVATTAALNRLPQALQQVAGQINTLDTQLEQARNVGPNLQETVPAQAAAAVSEQLQDLAEQTLPADSSTLNGANQTLQLDIQLDPALNLLDSATRGASQLERALDDINTVERVAQGLTAPLNDLPDLSGNLAALPANGTGYLIDPTPHLQVLRVKCGSLAALGRCLEQSICPPGSNRRRASPGPGSVHLGRNELFGRRRDKSGPVQCRVGRVRPSRAVGPRTSPAQPGSVRNSSTRRRNPRRSRTTSRPLWMWWPRSCNPSKSLHSCCRRTRQPLP